MTGAYDSKPCLLGPYDSKTMFSCTGAIKSVNHDNKPLFFFSYIAYYKCLTILKNTIKTTFVQLKPVHILLKPPHTTGTRITNSGVHVNFKPLDSTLSNACELHWYAYLIPVHCNILLSHWNINHSFSHWNIILKHNAGAYAY